MPQQRERSMPAPQGAAGRVALAGQPVRGRQRAGHGHDLLFAGAPALPRPRAPSRACFLTLHLPYPNPLYPNAGGGGLHDQGSLAVLQAAVPSLAPVHAHQLQA